MNALQKVEIVSELITEKMMDGFNFAQTLYLIGYIDNIINDITILNFRHVADGVLECLKEKNINPYQLSYLGSLEVFEYI